MEEKKDIIVKTDHLSVHFPVKGSNPFNRKYVKAVSDVSVEIRRGETFGLVGESGCGKSTFANAVLGMIKPTDGQVFFEGQDLNALPKKEMRALVRDILEAFPTVGLSILCPNGEQYLPRMNRLAHAYLKEEKAAWVLGELDAAPVPWYKVTLFAEPALFRKIRMYLAEKNFQDYRLEQDALRMQIYPKELGRLYTVEKLWELMRIKPENTYWLGGKGLPRELLEKMGAAAPGQMPAEKVVRASAEGCLGELLYALSKG